MTANGFVIQSFGGSCAGVSGTAVPSAAPPASEGDAGRRQHKSLLL